MYNLSFSTAVVPKKWEIAKITPIQMQGDHTHVNNLRKDYSILNFLNTLDPDLEGGGICRYLQSWIYFSEYKYKNSNTNCVNLESQWVSINQQIGKEII